MLKGFSVYLNSMVSFVSLILDNYFPKASSKTITIGGAQISIQEYIGWIE
jgi:hypothetical protein